jgi:tyrosinase
MAYRKNQRSLTAAEKKRFTDALLALKAEIKSGTLSTYDLFVKVHDDAMKDGYAHMGPAFLAWHREYLRRFELELQRISPPELPPNFSPERTTANDELGLPYWDWSIDQAAPSWPFTADFLGGDGSKDPGAPGKVMDGRLPFQPLAVALGALLGGLTATCGSRSLLWGRSGASTRKTAS